MNWVNSNKIKEIYIIVFISVILSAVVFFANFGAVGPMIQADEGSYLSNAAAIAGFSNDMASRYYAGYSILISPVFLLSTSPHTVWLFVKIINSILFFFIFFLLWVIAKKWSPSNKLISRLLAVFVVSIYPMWVIMVGYSFSQIAFVPIFLLTVVIFTEAVSGKFYAWLLLGLVSGFLYWIHPTAAPVLVALCVTLFFWTLKNKFFKRFFLFLIFLLGTLLFYRYGFKPWLMERMLVDGNLPNLHYPKFTEMLLSIFTPNGFLKSISILGGHIFYLTIGTLGLIVSGSITLFQKVFNLNSDEGELNNNMLHQPISLFLLLSLIGSIALSVISMFNATRLDHWMYGRYVEGVIAPILLISLLAYSRRKLIWGIFVAIVGAVLLFLSLDTYTHIAPFNISAFWQQFFIEDSGLLIWLVFGIIPMILVCILPRKVAYLLIIFYFIFCSYFQIKYHNPSSKNASERWLAALTVRDIFPLGTCVGFDQNKSDVGTRYVFWYDFNFVLFDYQLQRMSFDKWISDCDGPLFSYDKELKNKNHNIYPVAISPNDGPTLWVKGNISEIELYPATVEKRSFAILYGLGSGWYDLEKSHVWSSDTAELELQKPINCSTNSSCSASLRLSAYGASKTRPVKLIISKKDDGKKLKEIIFKNLDAVFVEVPFDKIILSIPNAISPSELQGVKDTRVLGVALTEIILNK